MNTICAISTAPGVGGIAVVRVSGDKAFDVVDALFFGKQKLSQTESHKALFGTIRESGNIIDEVLATVFKNPHSFTGEDTVEIACHGSQYIQQKILQLLIANGAELAQPGEFTQRAFLNGKMDLSQAEAVADLIASNSSAAHQLALKQMRGGFADELKSLRMHLLNFVSLVELELDFSEEDVEFADRTQLKELTQNIYSHLKRLVDSFSLGNAIKNGIPVAIVGQTNVGKSTLLNALLNEDKAIVSDIHGTTRDSIEDVVNLKGVAFRFIDTAGIRDTADKIESLGIERTYKKIVEANIVLLVLDATRGSEYIKVAIDEVRHHISTQKLEVVFNKKDQLSPDQLSEIKTIAPQDAIYLSAKEKENLDGLEERLVQLSEVDKASEANILVSNIRHFEALKRAQEAITRVIEGLENNVSNDFLAQDIRECLLHIGEITGNISTDEILGNIFSKFCIGK